MKYLTYLSLILLISACGSEEENKIYEFNENKNKWTNAVSNGDYSYMYKQICLCSYRNKEIIINVKDGNVVSVKLKNGQRIHSEKFKTINQHFKYIIENIRKEELGEKVKIKVEYDDILGYPSIIRVKHPGTDGNISLLISNVVIK